VIIPILSIQTLTEQRNINLFQRLAHNEPKIRQQTMKTFRARLAAMDDISEFDAMKIWKGFFFCMWMSDKPHVQQELARTLAASIHMFKPAVALQYYNAFLQTMAREYISIDRHRSDKFLSLIRRCVEAAFIYCRSRRWDINMINSFGEIHKKLFNDGAGLARPVVLFVAEIYVQSWAKSYSQDIFFRQLTEEEEKSKAEDEENHIFIDMDNNDVEAAIAEASKIDVSAMSWESFRGLFEPLLTLLRFSSDSALCAVIRNYINGAIVNVLRRLAEHVNAVSADEDEDDEDAESEAPAPEDTDALASTLIEVIHDFLPYLQKYAETATNITLGMRTMVTMFHAQLDETAKILMEMGVIEEPKPKEKAKKAKKGETVAEKPAKGDSKVAKAEGAKVEAKPAKTEIKAKKTEKPVVEEAPVVGKKAKKAVVPVQEEEEEEAPVVPEPKKKKNAAVKEVVEPVAAPVTVAADKKKKKVEAIVTAPVEAPVAVAQPIKKKNKAAAVPVVEEEEVVAKPVKKAKNAAPVEEEEEEVVVAKPAKKAKKAAAPVAEEEEEVSLPVKKVKKAKKDIKA